MSGSKCLTVKLNFPKLTRSQASDRLQKPESNVKKSAKSATAVQQARYRAKLAKDPEIKEHHLKEKNSIETTDKKLKEGEVHHQLMTKHTWKGKGLRRQAEYCRKKKRKFLESLSKAIERND